MKNSAVALTGKINCGGLKSLALSCLIFLINTSKNKVLIPRVMKIFSYFVATYKLYKERFI